MIDAGRRKGDCSSPLRASKLVIPIVFFLIVYYALVESALIISSVVFVYVPTLIVVAEIYQREFLLVALCFDCLNFFIFLEGHLPYGLLWLIVAIFLAPGGTNCAPIYGIANFGNKPRLNLAFCLLDGVASLSAFAVPPQQPSG